MWTWDQLGNLWGFIADRHKDLWDFVPQPWYFVGDSLVKMGNSDPQFQLLTVALYMAAGVWFARTADLQGHSKNLLRRTCQFAINMVTWLPILTLAALVWIDLMAIAFFYSLSMLVGALALALAFYGTIIEWPLRALRIIT